jgi:hypothetical protein
MRVFSLLLAGLVSARSLTKLATLVKAPASDLCGDRGFDDLPGGTKAYFDTIPKNLWVHPGNQEGFGVFKDELKCWYSKMIGGKCGGLPAQPDRKAKLVADCTSDTVDYLTLWNQHFTDAEFKWFKNTYPTVEGGDYSEAMKTMKDMNMKEVLCTTLFVIDDGCVSFKYVKTS